MLEVEEKPMNSVNDGWLLCVFCVISHPRLYAYQSKSFCLQKSERAQHDYTIQSHLHRSIRYTSYTYGKRYLFWTRESCSKSSNANPVIDAFAWTFAQTIFPEANSIFLEMFNCWIITVFGFNRMKCSWYSSEWCFSTYVRLRNHWLICNNKIWLNCVINCTVTYSAYLHLACAVVTLVLAQSKPKRGNKMENGGPFKTNIFIEN